MENACLQAAPVQVQGWELKSWLTDISQAGSFKHLLCKQWDSEDSLSSGCLPFCWCRKSFAGANNTLNKLVLEMHFYIPEECFCTKPVSPSVRQLQLKCGLQSQNPPGTLLFGHESTILETLGASHWLDKDYWTSTIKDLFIYSGMAQEKPSPLCYLPNSLTVHPGLCGQLGYWSFEKIISPTNPFVSVRIPGCTQQKTPLDSLYKWSLDGEGITSRSFSISSVDAMATTTSTIAMMNGFITGHLLFNGFTFPFNTLSRFKVWGESVLAILKWLS